MPPPALISARLDMSNISSAHIPRVVGEVGGSVAMGPPAAVRLTSTYDGLTSILRRNMNDYISGSNVLRTYKRPRIDHEDDPEAVVWERELNLERKQNEITNELLSDMLKNFKAEREEYDFTRGCAVYIDNILKFATQTKLSVEVMSKNIYERGMRGMLTMHRKHDELADFDRKLLRRDTRNEKLETDKASGVEIMREIHTKLVEVKAELKIVTTQSEKRGESLKAMTVMAERARCFICQDKILDGFVLQCRRSICGDCELVGSCPCSSLCEPAHPTKAVNYMNDMLWLMNLMEAVSVRDGVDFDINIEKAVKDYMEEEFQARSSVYRMSPEL
jgi:hypothetical protein